MLNKPATRKFLLYPLCCFILIFAVFFHFFVIKNVLQYPWWHQMGNDIDGAYATISVGLINDSPLQFTHHPGATVFSLQGLVFRLLSIVSEPHQALGNLSLVSNTEEAFKIIETAVKTGRVLALLTAAGFIIFLFHFLYFMSGRLLLAFLIAFYIATSKAFLFHTYVIRPELLNLFFFLLAVAWFFSQLSVSLSWMWMMVPIGFLLGCSVFAKIQIGPAVAIFFVLLARYCQQLSRAAAPRDISGSLRRACFLSALGNFVLFPWWTLKRPAFITAEYLSAMHPDADALKLYGKAPEGFGIPVLVIMLLFLSLSLMCFLFKEPRQKLVKQAISYLLPLNLIISGSILSTYCILLPVSMSFKGYIENTQHLVYSVFTNVLYGGYVWNKHFNPDTFKKIFHQHAAESSLLGLNILYFVAVVLAISAWQYFKKNSQSSKEHYFCVLFFLMTGLVMDIFSTLRSWTLYSHYAFYSICFYGLGLAMGVAGEKGKGEEGFGYKKIFNVRCAAAAVLAVHLMVVSWQWVTTPKADASSSHNLKDELMNIQAHSQPFFEMITQAIQSH